MALFGNRQPAPPPTPADVQLAALTGRVDQAVTHIDTALRQRGRVSQRELVDVLLEIRHTLAGNHDRVDA